MKKQVIGAGVAIVALAGGVMFCGDVDDVPHQDVTHTTNAGFEPATNNAEPKPAEPVKALIRLATASRAVPTFWAVRAGEGQWQRPGLVGNAFELELPSQDTPYTVVTMCQAGEQSYVTTVLEATAKELPSPALFCTGTPEAAQQVQVSGAVRGAAGRAVTLSVGTTAHAIDNPKQAADVLFGINAPVGERTFVALREGDDKLNYGFARKVSVAEGTLVEIDLGAASPLATKEVAFATDGDTMAVDGTYALWADGTTRFGGGGLPAWDKGGKTAATLRVTGQASDYFDVRTAVRGMNEPPAKVPNTAFIRAIGRADREGAVVLPQMWQTGPSRVKAKGEGFEFAWSTHNWEVFGFSDGNLAAFVPVAYVASVTSDGPVQHRLNVAVTPSRAGAATPYYALGDLSTIEGWQNAWSLPARQDLAGTSGNLAAYAGTDAVEPGLAIAAYFDEARELSPAELGVNDELTLVAGGSPIIPIPGDKSLLELVEARCFEVRPCAVEMKQDIMAVTKCPEISAINDCREPSGMFNVNAGDFVRDLKHRIIWWYNADVEIPGALPLETALANISEDNVHVVTDRTADEWYAYNPEMYQVFWHPDPTRVDSRTVWYGAYLTGRLVSLYPVNWDARPKK